MSLYILAGDPVGFNNTNYIGHQSNSSPSQSTTSAPKVEYDSPRIQNLGGIQTTSSFHSISSMDSSTEMAKYFPEASTPSSLPIRHQQQVEGQIKLPAAYNTALSANTNTFNAGSHSSASIPIATQQIPQSVLGVHSMAQHQQQQQQQQVQPPGS